MLKFALPGRSHIDGMPGMILIPTRRQFGNCITSLLKEQSDHERKRNLGETGE